MKAGAGKDQFDATCGGGEGVGAVSSNLTQISYNTQVIIIIMTPRRDGTESVAMEESREGREIRILLNTSRSHDPVFVYMTVKELIQSL